MPEPFKLVFVTGNAYKLSEARIILGPDAELESVALDIPEIQGTAEEIAIDKCQRAAQLVRFAKLHSSATDDEVSSNDRC